MTSREQQLAEAIWTADGDPWQLASDEDRAQAMEWAAAVEPFLVAAERAGYERCKRDAAPAFTLLRDLRQWDQLPDTGDGPYWIKRIDDALAVVAALNATKQEADAAP